MKKEAFDKVHKVVSSAITAAAQYFVVEQKLTFVEINEKLEMFLRSILCTEVGFEKVSCLLHEHVDGNYFDIGIMLGGAVMGLRLEEVLPGRVPKSTLH